MNKLRLWGECGWPELRDAADEGAIVVIPLGATEQHGPHLPVYTDTLIASRLALLAGEAATVPVVIAPSLPFGYSPYHSHLPGTITLRRETLTALLLDVCRSIHSHGFRRLFVLNAHGGNGAYIDSNVTALAEEGIYVAAASWWAFAAGLLDRVLESELGGANHACEMETSVILYLAPDLVGPERPKELARAETPWGWRDFRSGGDGGVSFPVTPLTRSPIGVYGDSTLASAAKGEAIVSHVVSELARLLTDLSDWSPEEDRLPELTPS